MIDDRVTIRGVERHLLDEARQIVRYNRYETMGSFVSSALELYIDSLPVVVEADSAEVLPAAL